MRILWLTSMVVPEFAQKLGLAQLNQGGWIPSLIDAVRQYAPQIELTVACIAPKEVTWDCRGVRYVSMSNDCNHIQQKIAELHPDLIHIHGTEGEWSTLPTYINDLPIVVSLQGIRGGIFPHYVGGLLPKEVASIKNLVNFLFTRYSVYRAAECWRRKLAPKELVAFQQIHTILGRTEWDCAWTKYLAPQARYYTVGEVLREPFFRGGRSVETVVPHTIFCGAAFAYSLKGGHWLLRAVAALKTKYPNLRLRVANSLKVARPVGWKAWIKQGEYHRYLRKLIDELGLENHVELLPSLTAEQVADELKRAELFVLPSHCENSPNSLGEAMLMGCPAIATYAGGIPSILKDGVEGILVPSGDPAILADRIDYLLSNPTVAQNYAEAAQRTAQKRYAPSRVVVELLEAYQGVLSR